MKQLFLLILSIFSSICCVADYKYELSISAIFKDDAPYLKEWIEFHRLMGAEHFYLCSHNGTDDYLKVLIPYIKLGIVELCKLETGSETDNVTVFNRFQARFYTKCLAKARGVSRWVAFLDTDEFLFPTKEKSLPQVLKRYQDCAGIAVNWHMFGTSGVKKIPSNKLLIECLTRCAPENLSTHFHIKSIVQPDYAVEFCSVHYPEYQAGFFQVNTDRVPFSGPYSPYIQLKDLKINHYWLRDEHFFYQYKIPRRINWGLPKEDLIEAAKALEQETNGDILRFVPRLRKKMGLK